MAVEEDLKEIRTKISDVRAKKARAEVEHDNAVARREAALAVLRDEFKVNTTAEAKAVQVGLETALEEAIVETRTALTEAGA